VSKDTVQAHTSRENRIILSCRAPQTLMEVAMEPDQTSQEFEEVYPQYEFAPLVQIALKLAERTNRITATKFRRIRKEVDRHLTGPSHAN